MTTDTTRMKETGEILREKNSGPTLKRMLFGIDIFGVLVGYVEISHLNLTRLLLFVKQMGSLYMYIYFICLYKQHSYINNI